MPLIDRAACRADVELRFFVRRMVDDHLGVYRRAIAGHRVVGNPGPRHASATTTPHARAS